MKNIYLFFLCVVLLITFNGCKDITPVISESYESGVSHEYDISSESAENPDESGAESPEESDAESMPDESETSEISGVTDVYVYNADYVTEKIGEDYSITYKITYYYEDADAKTAEVTIARNGGGYYINTGSMEYMYVKNGEGYSICSKDELTGLFRKIPGVVISAEDVDKSATAALYMFFNDAKEEDLVSAGDAVVCGRVCGRYVLDASARHASTDMEFYIDKAAGICLKYTCSSPAEGENGGIDYECVAFRLGGAELPDYTD